jgi:hypothetical protein
MIYALFVCTLFAQHPEMSRCHPAAPLVAYRSLQDCERQKLKVYRAYTGRAPDEAYPTDKPLPAAVNDVVCMERPDWQPATGPR